MSDQTVVVVIPAYKKKLKHNEMVSLCQAIKILSAYDIYLIEPKGMHETYGFSDVQIINFDAHNFANVKSYSCFMLSEEIYRSFIDYDYLLVHQLDAFVFEDRLSEFLGLGLDYIGAPTLEGMYKPYRAEKVLFTQNGGLSLRKIDAFLRWIKQNVAEIALMNKYDDEDSIIYALRKKGITIASEDIALKFSFDSNVRECFRRTNGEVPFGCHAWERYDIEMWKPLIEAQGYIVEACDESDVIIKDYYQIKKYNDAWVQRYDSSILVAVIRRLLKSFEGDVYVWGMGKHGYDAMQLLLGAGVNIISFVDVDKNKVREGMYPCEAMTVQEVFDGKREAPFVVAMYNYVDVCVFLEKRGLRHNVDYITYAELYAAFEVQTMK